MLCMGRPHIQNMENGDLDTLTENRAKIFGVLEWRIAEYPLTRRKIKGKIMSQVNKPNGDWQRSGVTTREPFGYIADCLGELNVL